MFDLPWRKIVLVALFALTTLFADAQIRGTYNYLDFANKPYYFGITLSYNSSNYRVIQGQDFILSDSISTVLSPRGPGFNLGIVTNLKIGKFFDFRLLPTLSFSDRRLEYHRTGTGRIETKKIEAVFIEAPFLIRYKSAPYKDIRLFVVAGVKYSYDVASNSRTRQAASLVKVSPSDFSVEYGFGIQFFFPYFIFSPEIKVSQGLSNILISDNDLIYSSVLDRILSRTLTISFHFEG
ncbi:MAG: outer membrane beta-barrel protein [Bacteroidota bacterium]